MKNRSERFRDLLNTLQPTLLEVRDDSHKHAGHAAMQGLDSGETHFHIAIHSAKFEGKSRIERHRMVQSLVKEEFDSGLHALQIKAELPQA